MADTSFHAVGSTRSHARAQGTVQLRLSGNGTHRKIISIALCTALVVQNPSQAMAFEWLNFRQQQQHVESAQVDRDPIEPFTIYGSISKKYLIEQTVKGKIIARKRGFTASACMNILEANAETPELQGIPTDFKLTLIGDPCCAKGEGQSREDSCQPPCERVCELTIKRHLEIVKQATGYDLDPEDRTRVTKSCFKQCFGECTKPGNTISFILPFRPKK